MPFPWKKAKSSRISQLVNNHLQKRRGDSSLVVETRFPTSLVDLAIKNGDKMKKQSKKKRAKPPLIPLENENNDPVILQSSCILPSPSFTPSPSPSRCPLPSCSPLPPETRDFDEVAVGTNESGVGRRVVCANGVAVAVVKMVLVVVLALGMKKFVVGITISAFLLIFLEYVGKNACGMLNLCSDAQKGLRLIVQRIQRFFRFKEDNSDQNNEDCFDPGCSGFKNCESMSSFQETKVMEPDCGEKEIMDEHICKEKLGYQEIDSKKVVMEDDESTCEVLELKRRKSPKDKIKSKMTKIVPKKLHSSKKEEHNSESSEISSVIEDTIASCEEQEADESEDEKESKFLEPNCVEGIQCEKMIIDEYSCEGKLGYQEISLKKVMMEEEESKCEVLELKRRKSRREKIKSKMKKLVPKKLRSSKKEENNSESSEIYSIKEDTISTCEEDESEDQKIQKL